MKTQLFTLLLLLCGTFCQSQPLHEMEPNNSAATANDLTTLPTAANAMSIHLTQDSLQFNGDVDWYKVRIFKAGLLSVNIPLNVSGFTFCITVRDSADTYTVHSLPSIATPNNAPLNQVIVPAGEWKISIWRYGGLNDGFWQKNNFYDLIVSLDTMEAQEWNNDHSYQSTASATANPLPPNATVTGYIRGYYDRGGTTNDRIDRDIYKVRMESAGELSAYIAANNTNMRLRIQLEDSNFNAYGSTFTASSPGGGFTAKYNISAGTWYIVVTSADVSLSDQPYTLQLNMPVGISAVTKGLRAIITPNPARRDIDLTLPENVSQADFVLVNMAGQTVMSRAVTGRRTRLTLPDIAGGLYIVRLHMGSAVFTDKLLIE